MTSKLDLKDITASLLCVLIGGFFAIVSVTTLPLGTARQMGPGYFPFLVGCILLVLGLIMGFRAIRSDTPSAFDSVVSLRSLLSILVAPVVFGLTVRSLGLVPAILLTALASSFANERAGLRHSILLASMLTVFCVLVFSFGLGMNLPLFGAWAARLGWS